MFQFIKNIFSGLFSKSSATQVSSPATVVKPPVSGKILGIDISHHNGLVDWAAIKAAGVQFAYLKCTEGLGYFDPMFTKNVVEAKRVGILVGAYHFFHPNVEAGAQARFFLSKLNGLYLDLIPCCDWEVHDGLGEAAQVGQVKAFVDVLETAIGKKPMIYTGKWFMDEVQARGPGPLLDWLAQYPLWLSDYSPQSVAVPRPWTTYKVLQYTETGVLQGVIGKFDLNEYVGDIADLKV